MPPTVTARQTPVGKRLEKGRVIKVAFSLDPDISIWEVSAQLPGADAGDTIDTTTQWNETVRQKAFRELAEITDGSLTVGYDPQALPQILAILGKPGAFTYYLPNGASMTYWGGARTFEPNEHTEGDFPTAQMTLAVTNTDPDTGAEEGPLYTAPP